jgi:hypothetical protein
VLAIAENRETARVTSENPGVTVMAVQHLGD